MKAIAKEAITLGLLMFDPENQPPQITQGQAFGRLKELREQFMWAGAGGRALALAESDQEGDSTMTTQTEKDTKMEKTEPVTLSEQVVPVMPAPAMLAKEKVAHALAATRLPPVSILSLFGREYPAEAELQEAIRAEIEVVKATTGSGRPFGLGGGAAEQKPLTEKEKAERFNLRCAEVGLSPIPVPGN
jgi:hypothetical protein